METLKDFFEKYRRVVGGNISHEPESQVVADEYQQYEHERRGLSNEAYRDNIKARKRYSRAVFIVMIIWLGVVLWVLIGSGLGYIPLFCSCCHCVHIGFFNFKLSDPVLIALITTTTANVIFLFRVILNHLFPAGSQ